jgi:hypothetical protein
MTEPKYIVELRECLSEIKLQLVQFNANQEKSLALFEQRVKVLEDSVSKHNRTLYRSNGELGLTDKVDEVKRDVVDVKCEVEKHVAAVKSDQDRLFARKDKLYWMVVGLLFTQVSAIATAWMLVQMNLKP